MKQQCLMTLNVISLAWFATSYSNSPAKSVMSQSQEAGTNRTQTVSYYYDLYTGDKC